MKAALRLPLHRGLPRLRIAIILCPSFTLTPMASFVDALRLAADQQDRSQQVYFAWDFLSAGPPTVRSSCGLEVRVRAALGRADAYDCVAVCGGLVRDMADVPPATYDYLRAVAARGVPVVGLCTGSFVLAQAGLLERRTCALHFSTLPDFIDRFKTAIPVIDRNYVVDGNIITCPGSVVAIDVATLLITSYSDEARAKKALNYLLFKPDEKRVLLKPRAYDEDLRGASRLVVTAVRVMESRVDDPCSVEDLARSLDVSKSQLTRAFLTDLNVGPAGFWRLLRLTTARDMLLDRRCTITEVAYATGFSDTAHFCHSFKHHFAMTPQAYRRRAKGDSAGLPAADGGPDRIEIGDKTLGADRPHGAAPPV